MIHAQIRALFFRICLGLASLALSGCSNGYRAQPIALPIEALDSAADLASQDPLIDFHKALPSDWWTLFQDEQLNEFIKIAFSRNPTLEIARAKISSAQFQADKARSYLFPTLSWGADVSRQKLSETGIIPFNQNKSPLASNSVSGLPATGGVDGIPVYFTQYQTEFLLTYEFDFWGKNRNTLKAAIGNMQAAIADEIFTRLQLGVAIAKSYFQLQADYKRQAIARRLVKNREEYLALIEKRLAHNMDTDIILNQSKINLSLAKQTLLQIEADIIVNEYKLKYYLAGNFDEVIQDLEITECSLATVPLPSDIPLNLIAHRPDIIAQLWMIESAGKQIEVAKAGFYPNFSLGSVFGFQTIHLHKLFRWPSAEYNIDPAVNLPIFDGGLLCANLHTSEVNYDLAIYQYNQLVLNAAKEVLEGLALLRNSEERRQEYSLQALQQKNIFELTTLRMQNRLNSMQDTLLAEENMLIAQDDAAIALGNTMQSIITLIKALGGGYEICYEAEAS